MTPEYAIAVEGLTRDFGSFRAVDGVTFTVERGEIFGFMGPNGAGKSTTIRMLTGHLLPTAGSGRVAGLDIIRDHRRLKEHTGYMPQGFSLYEDLTVMENLRFFGGMFGLGGKRLKERSAEVLNLVGLYDRRRQLARHLSLGHRQRLGLASAILHEPSILLLDEPTSGVDPMSRRQFWEMIYGLAARGVTVLVTTHYLDEDEFCDRLAIIHLGRLIALGAPGELKAALPHQILAVFPDRLGEALQVVKSLPEVEEAAVFGAGLHLASSRLEAAEAAVQAALTARGIRVRRLHRVSPTLEDAFISLVAKAERARS
uniref:ABC transporter ATP-binding protein n=1 Tax=Desulfobacca acetoxidans TaxID=60893 RepID=A0A7V4GA07_9BACT